MSNISDCLDDLLEVEEGLSTKSVKFIEQMFQLREKIGEELFFSVISVGQRDYIDSLWDQHYGEGSGNEGYGDPR